VKAIWKKGDGKYLVGVYVREKRLAFGLNFVFGGLHYASIFVSKQCDVNIYY
jgi:hypothetical protein